MTVWERWTRWAGKPFRGRARMLTCQEQVELLTEYLDGTLPPETTDTIECHGIKQRVTYEYGAYALERV